MTWKKKEDMSSQAQRSVRQTIMRGSTLYSRRRILPRLIPVRPEEMETDTAETRQSIVSKLKRALTLEEDLGRLGHWTYDANRQIALLQALEAEEKQQRQEKL